MLSLHVGCLSLFFFFFKQKTAYEMRISDWSSDVCSSDLLLATGLSPILGPTARDSVAIRVTGERLPPPDAVAGRIMDLLATTDLPGLFAGLEPPAAAPDRKSVV